MDYHYRVKQLDDKLLKSILEECANLLLEDKQILCYIADATGFGFGDKYKLNWERGTQIRTVQSHVRLEVIRAVDENNYESEIEMLRKALKKLEPQKRLPFIADICLVSCTIGFLEQPHSLFLPILLKSNPSLFYPIFQSIPFFHILFPL